MRYYKCSSAVLEMDLKPSTLQVYHFLAAHADFSTRECWYGKKTIAARLNISVSSVSRALRELKEKEIIKITARKDMSRPQGKRQICNLYELVSDKTQKSMSNPNNNSKTLVRYFKGSFKLTGTELKVYTYLCKRAGRSNTCFPSYKVIATSLGISRMTAIRTIQALVYKNVIKKTTRLHAAYRGGKATGCNIYTILMFLNNNIKKFKNKAGNYLYRLFNILKKGKKESCRHTADNLKNYIYIIYCNVKKSRLFFIKKLLR